MSLNFCWPKFGKMKATHINENLCGINWRSSWCCDFAWVFAIISTGLLMFPLHVSNERHPCLRYVGDDTTQLYRDYTKPLIRIPKKTTRIQWKVFGRFFFRGLCGYQKSWVPEPPIRTWRTPRSRWKSWKICVALWVSRPTTPWRDGDEKSEWVDRKNSVLLTVSFCEKNVVFSVIVFGCGWFK